MKTPLTIYVVASCGYDWMYVSPVDGAVFGAFTTIEAAEICRALLKKDSAHIVPVAVDVTLTDDERGAREFPHIEDPL